MRQLLPLLLLPIAAACSSDSAIPEGAGEGVVRWDREAPAGAEVFKRPEWTVGDRFVYASGDWLELALEVVEIDEERIVLEETGTGARQLLDRDLGVLGQELEGDEAATRVNAPADSMFRFPLWVGKRWAVEYLSKRPGGEPVPFTVEYHCDAIETLALPVGPLRCLRIWRTAKVGLEGKFQDRTTLDWYAPEIGYIARRLENGVLLSLREAHRQ